VGIVDEALEQVLLQGLPRDRRPTSQRRVDVVGHALTWIVGTVRV
jgi:hypothetical protein